MMRMNMNHESYFKDNELDAGNVINCASDEAS